MAEKSNDKRSFNPPSRVGGIPQPPPNVTRGSTFAQAGAGSGTATAPAQEQFRPCDIPNCVLHFGHTGAHGIPMTAIPSLASKPVDKPEPQMLTDLRAENIRIRAEVIAHERAVKELDEKSSAIEYRISWLERHPEAVEIFSFVEEVRKGLERDRESIHQAG